MKSIHYFTDMTETFYEKQHVQIWWLKLLIGLLTLGMWVSFVVQIFYGIPVGNNPSPDWMMYPLLLLIGVGFPWFFFTMNLNITVTDKQLVVKYFPFITKKYTREDIGAVKPTTFRPIREHGGWGIKYSADGVWVYTAYGNTGVELTFRDGKRIIVGSQRAEELAKAINDIL